MRILWIKTDFLHPTNRGGQIRTLEMLKRLHRDHEVHYIAFGDLKSPEGPERAGEYSSHHSVVAHHVPDKRSLAFGRQLVQGLVSELPVAVLRYRSANMARVIAETLAAKKFDSVVCDFLFPAPNVADLSRCVLFQHNVEAMIWQRHTEHAPTPVHRLYFAGQHARMLNYERQVCNQVRRVIAVSETDAEIFRRDYGVRDVTVVATGVDIDYFRPPAEAVPGKADLVFLGSMDWMPNIDGVRWFTSAVLPQIHARRPETTLAVVGRKPTPEIAALTTKDARIQVTGTVADVRPWLHGSKVSIVPLRIGGGTRLKIYEAMAAGIPVVSTAVGAEGLNVQDSENIFLADSPDALAARCLQLLNDESRRRTLAAKALKLVMDRYSWDAVTTGFEQMIAP